MPESATVCGLPVPLSLIRKLAVRNPAAVGVNVTEMVQLAFAAKLPAHVLLKPKSPGSAPAIATPLKVNVEVVSFVTVTTCAALVVPSETVPKFKLVGDTSGGQGVPTFASASQVACAAVLAESVCDCEM